MKDIKGRLIILGVFLVASFILFFYVVQTQALPPDDMEQPQPAAQVLTVTKPLPPVHSTPSIQKKESRNQTRHETSREKVNISK